MKLLLLIAVLALPSSAATTVNFDSPGCPNGNNGSALVGTYQGIKWGTSPWDCEVVGSPTDTTTSASWNQNITSASFTFVTASVLTSLKAGTSAGSGTYTISTNAGESISRTLTSGNPLTLITTGFTKAATTVTISYTGGWTVETDDITYTTGSIVAVSVSPQTVTLPPSATQQFTAMVTGTSNTSVTWAVTSGTGTINTASGLFTAPSHVCSETDSIKATSVADTSKSATATATITGNQPHSVNLSWNDGDSGVTFNLYRSQTSGGPYQQIQSGITGLTTLDNTVQSGQTYYYVVRAFNGQESVNSNQTQSIVPCP